MDEAQALWRRGAVMIALSALIWSGAGLFMRALGHLDLPAIQFWRAVFGAASLYLLVWRLREAGARAALSLDWRRAAAVLVCAAAALTYIAALHLTSVAEVMIVAATMPLIAAFIAWLWLGQRPDRITLVASLTALIGVVVMAGGISDPQSLLGDLVALLMAGLFALLLVIPRRWPGIDMIAANAHGAVLCALVSAPFAGAALGAVGLRDLALLALFGVLTTGVATALLFAGARLVAPAAAALILLLDNVLSPVWVWLAFDERPGPAAFIGGAIVFLAVTLHIVLGARRRPLAESP